MNFTAIDFETASQHFPCAVGIAIVENNEIVNEFYSLIDPEVDFNPYTIRIHGITPDLVIGEPTFSELWEEISGFLSNTVIVAHNTAFDMTVLRKNLSSRQRTALGSQSLCTLQASRSLLPELDNHRLSTVAEYFGISFEHHHALEDASACAKIAIQLSSLDPSGGYPSRFLREL